MLGTRGKTIVVTLVDPEIENNFQKLKGLRAKKQLFKEGSSLSSSVEATEIDNEGMEEAEQTMAKLAINQGTGVSQPIRPPNTRDNQINFPSWVHNELIHNQFMGASTKDP